MLKREDLFDAMSGIRDEYIDSAADLLGYAKEENIMQSETQTAGRYSGRKLGRILLIAAVIVCLLTATAYATGVFTFSTRVPDAEETFRIRWDESEQGYLEWKDAKLVLTFPAAAESREIEFRPGWLPFELASEMPGCQPWSGLSSDTWFRRFSAESLMWQNGKAVPFSPGTVAQPLQIEVYSMSQFNDGGGMLMLYCTPGEITEEHWDESDADVMIFTATEHFDARPELRMDAYTLTYNHVLLANAEEGWIVSVCGELDRDTIVKTAKILEIRLSGETFTYDDFDSHFLFFDGGVG